MVVLWWPMVKSQHAATASTKPQATSSNVQFVQFSRPVRQFRRARRSHARDTVRAVVDHFYAYARADVQDVQRDGAARQ